MLTSCFFIYFFLMSLMLQAQSSSAKGLPGIAINEDTLREAASETPPRSLFEEVLAGKWAVVIVSPEMLTTPGFNQVLTDRSFQQHLCLIFIDECHLVEEQGYDFRPCYKSIGLLRSRVPTHIPWVAVSATLPPGKTFDIVMDSLGFQANHYIHHTLPIDNTHICYIPKFLDYPTSSTTFLDLAWLIPPSAVSPEDIPKTLIFCEKIELGSRVHTFLQHLLPESLHRNREAILPYHSLLSRPGRTQAMQNFQLGTTRIIIGTDCFTWGVDVPDIRYVVVFGLPSSFSKLVQQIGRAGRDGNQAYAITYVAQWVKDIPEDLQKHTKQEIANLKRRETICPALRAWFNASSTFCPRMVFCDHFGEPTYHPENCCIYHHKISPNTQPTISLIQQFSSSHTKPPTVHSDRTYKSFGGKEFAPYRDSASRLIADWARVVWEERRGANNLFPSTAFFPEALQKRLSDKIHLISSAEKLHQLLSDWQHIDEYGHNLFKFCSKVVKGLEEIRQDMQGGDEMDVDEETDQPSIKIKIPALKQKVCEEDPDDARPSKRQCRR